MKLTEALNDSPFGVALAEDTKASRYALVEVGVEGGYDLRIGTPGMPPDESFHYDTLEQLDAVLRDIAWLKGVDWISIEEEDEN